MELPRLLTSDELSDYLQVPVRTIEDWRKDKKGPRFVRAGKRVRYRLVDIDEWLQRGGDADQPEA